MKYNLILLLLLIFFTSCKIDDHWEAYYDFNDQLKTIDINFINKNRYEDGDGYYLGRLSGVSLDIDDNIYLFDELQSTAIVLNKDGEYLDDLFGPGNGPGEIHSFSSNTINLSKNEIILADGQNFKILKKSIESNDLIEINYNPSHLETPKKIIHYKEDEYLFLLSLFGSQREGGLILNDDAMVHHVDLNGSDISVVNSFINRNEIFQVLGYTEGSVSHSFTKGFIGNIAYSNGSIIYAPFVYNNNIFEYKKDSNNVWKLNSVIKGSDIKRKAYIDIEVDSGNIERGRNLVSTSGAFGGTSGYINRRNIGVYTIGNDYLAVFFVEEFDVGEAFMQSLYVEIFDHNFNFKGVSNLLNGSNGEIMWSVDWKDRDDNFYLIGDIHYIIKFSMQII